MNKDLDERILRLDGKEYDDKPTLGSILFTAIQALLPADRDMTGEQKMVLYRLAKKVVDGGVVDFDSKELALLKSRAEAALPPLVLGPVVELLDTDYEERTHHTPLNVVRN